MIRTIEISKTPLLGLALLGLLQQKPSSGYDLVKTFSRNPIGRFSSSPGAIYPALRRLEERQLIIGRIDSGSGMRQRKTFRPTAAGRSALKMWLKRPIKREDVVRGMEELLLRFALMDGVLTDAQTLRFLEALDEQLRAYLAVLRDFSDSKMPLTATLALKSGVLGYTAQLDWASEAIAAYRKRCLDK
ncbi:MAG TPA: PadR family transcriptional regulator [Candidatus Binataceae bacterium]|jgi:DNA-binding PadR family transcriptional regulator